MSAEQAEAGLLMWAIGGVATLFGAGYAHVFKRGDSIREEGRVERAEIWKRLDEIADSRVKRTDLTNITEKQDEMLDEIRIVRGNVQDLSQQVYFMQGAANIQREKK